jgi:hypothetical protein
MSATTELDRATIVRIVRSWPDDEQLSLIQDVLQILRAERAALPRRPTLAQARGLLKADQAPPSDLDIQQWLDERRIERYGA